MNKYIAAELGTGEQNIKIHRRTLIQKMEVKSLAELVRLAERLALSQCSNSRRPSPHGYLSCICVYLRCNGLSAPLPVSCMRVTGTMTVLAGRVGKVKHRFVSRRTPHEDRMPSRYAES
jgi:hypothetical protein